MLSLRGDELGMKKCRKKREKWQREKKKVRDGNPREQQKTAGLTAAG